MSDLTWMDWIHADQAISDWWEAKEQEEIEREEEYVDWRERNIPDDPEARSWR